MILARISVSWNAGLMLPMGLLASIRSLVAGLRRNTPAAAGADVDGSITVIRRRLTACFRENRANRV